MVGQIAQAAFDLLNLPTDVGEFAVDFQYVLGAACLLPVLEQLLQRLFCHFQVCLARLQVGELLSYVLAAGILILDSDGHFTKADQCRFVVFGHNAERYTAA